VAQRFQRCGNSCVLIGAFAAEAMQFSKLSPHHFSPLGKVFNTIEEKFVEKWNVTPVTSHSPTASTFCTA